MRLSVVSLFGLAMALPLLGQGCATDQSESVRTSNDPIQIDASVDAMIQDTSAVDRVEATGDADADLIENNKTELNSYSEMHYELP